MTLRVSGIDEVIHPVIFSIRFDGDVGTTWHVRTIDIREELSGAYVATVDVESDDIFADPSALMGMASVLSMVRDEPTARPRFWAGVTRAVEDSFMADASRRRYARLFVEPAFACLREETQTRRLQEMTVPQIVRDVLAATDGSLNRSVVAHLVREQERPNSELAYATRDLCFQYGESTYEFLRRILAEEGISYFFGSNAERETLFLADDTLGFVEHDVDVPIILNQGVLPKEESISVFAVRQGRSARRATIKAFDPTRHIDIESRRERADDQGPAGSGDAITYDPGSQVTFFSAKDDAYTQTDIEAQARLQIEREICASMHGQGTSTVLGFRPGLVFKLNTDSLAGAFDGGKFLVTSVRHQGRNPTRRGGDVAEAGAYSNEFGCMPAHIQFRPPIIPKPRAIEDWGIVVSESDGDPILTDRHGRVKVRFGSDRDQQRPSTWLPVAQAWAGPGYGIQIIPRAGMVVRIRYLFGDPDRPFVAGCLTTARNVLPSALPEGKSRLTIRTRSLRNGGNDLEHYNEISLEDAAGREEVFIRAGHDYRREVLNDERVAIGHDEHRLVGHDQTIEVHGHRKITVTKDESTHIKQGRTVEIAGNDERHVHGKDTVTIDRESSTIVHGTRTTFVAGLEKETFNAGRLQEVEGKDELKVTETLSVVADEEFRATQGTTTFALKGGDASLRAAGSITLKVDGATLLMKPDGEAVLQCDKRLELACGEARVVLTPDKVEIAAPEVQLTGANGAVTLDSSGATTTGLNILSSALGTNELTGAFVKAN